MKEVKTQKYDRDARSDSDSDDHGARGDDSDSEVEVVPTESPIMIDDDDDVKCGASDSEADSDGPSHLGQPRRSGPVPEPRPLPVKALPVPKSGGAHAAAAGTGPLGRRCIAVKADGVQCRNSSSMKDIQIDDGGRCQFHQNADKWPAIDATVDPAASRHGHSGSLPGQQVKISNSRGGAGPGVVRCNATKNDGTPCQNSAPRNVIDVNGRCEFHADILRFHGNVVSGNLVASHDFSVGSPRAASVDYVKQYAGKPEVQSQVTRHGPSRAPSMQDDLESKVVLEDFQWVSDTSCGGDSEDDSDAEIAAVVAAPAKPKSELVARAAPVASIGKAKAPPVIARVLENQSRGMKLVEHVVTPGTMGGGGSLKVKTKPAVVDDRPSDGSGSDSSDSESENDFVDLPTLVKPGAFPPAPDLKARQAVPPMGTEKQSKSESKQPAKAASAAVGTGGLKPSVDLKKSSGGSGKSVRFDVGSDACGDLGKGSVKAGLARGVPAVPSPLTGTSSAVGPKVSSTKGTVKGKAKGAGPGTPQASSKELEPLILGKETAGPAVVPVVKATIAEADPAPKKKGRSVSVKQGTASKKPWDNVNGIPPGVVSESLWYAFPASPAVALKYMCDACHTAYDWDLVHYRCPGRNFGPPLPSDIIHCVDNADSGPAETTEPGPELPEDSMADAEHEPAISTPASVSAAQGKKPKSAGSGSRKRHTGRLPFPQLTSSCMHDASRSWHST